MKKIIGGLVLSGGLLFAGNYQGDIYNGYITLGSTDGRSAQGYYVGASKIFSEAGNITALNYFIGLKHINAEDGKDSTVLGEAGIKGGMMFMLDRTGTWMAEAGATLKGVLGITGGSGDYTGIGVGPYADINYMPLNTPWALAVGAGYNYILSKEGYDETYLKAEIKLSF